MAKKRTGRRTPGNPAISASTRARGSLLEVDSVDVSTPLSTYGDPLEELAGLVNDRRELDELIGDLVLAARATGTTWTSLARALGVSPQAVQKRYGSTSATERQQ